MEKRDAVPYGTSRDGVHSVARALDLLELLASAADPVSISDLSAASGQPIATIHRLLMTLISRGYVVRDGRLRRYALGPAASKLSQAPARTPHLDRIALPFLRELAALSGETANLAVLDRDRAVYIAQAQPARLMRMFTETGNRVYLHSTGCGKVLLAHQPYDVIDSLIARTGLPAATTRTIVDQDRLMQVLQDIRHRRYAIDDEEQEDGVRCLAVPVQDAAGQVIAAMSISGPASRLDDVRIQTLVPTMQHTSAALTAALAGDTATQGSRDDATRSRPSA